MDEDKEDQNEKNKVDDGSESKEEQGEMDGDD